jgi:hypothetical protein
MLPLWVRAPRRRFEARRRVRPFGTALLVYLPMAGLVAGCEIVAGIQDIALSSAEDDGSPDGLTLIGDSSGTSLSLDDQGDASSSQEENGDAADTSPSENTDEPNPDTQPSPAADGAPGVLETGAHDTGADQQADGDAYAEGGHSGFCTSQVPQPRFCDDFDEHPLPGFWGTFNQVGGTLALDKAASVSSPNSLLAQYSSLQPGQQLDTALRASFSLPPPPATIIFQFQLQPAVVDPTAGAVTVVASIDFVDVSNNRYSTQFALAQQGGVIRLRLEEQSGFADGGSAYVSHPLPDPLSIGVWTNVRLVITRTAATTASARVSFGNASEIDTKLAMTVNGTMLQVAIGSSFESEPSLGWKIRYDDVTLDF